jgi:hypothetical protein
MSAIQYVAYVQVLKEEFDSKQRRTQMLTKPTIYGEVDANNDPITQAIVTSLLFPNNGLTIRRNRTAGTAVRGKTTAKSAS